MAVAVSTRYACTVTYAYQSLVHFNVAAMDSVCWREQYLQASKVLQPFFYLRVLCMYICLQGRQKPLALHHACKLVLRHIACSQCDEVRCRVSNELGAGNPEAAHHVCNLGLSLVLAATCCLSLPIYIFRYCLTSRLCCLLACLLTSPQNHPLTPSPTHPFTNPLTYSSNPLTHAFTHPLTHLLPHPTPSLTYSQTRAHSPIIHLTTQHSYPILTQACMRISAHIWFPNDKTERH